MWRKKDRRSWKLEKQGFEGFAKVIEVEGGYRAVMEIEDKEYGMSLKDLREFFQSENEAERFLKKRMEEFD
ncbi:MAG: hypothetical protein SVV03_04150 [Candidatus Nanohaloarchaea archaeon]|nr:hypothetical protein [Candidatus Nanohaloarchaea archaeon]